MTETFVDSPLKFFIQFHFYGMQEFLDISCHVVMVTKVTKWIPTPLKVDSVFKILKCFDAGQLTM